MIEVTVGCSNGHAFEAAQGVNAEGQKAVSIRLADLPKVCPGCGNAVSVIRVSWK